jgi:hypothetical protein
VLAQGSADRLVGRGHHDQDVLAAEIAVPEPEGLLIGADRDAARLRGSQ